MTVTYLRTDEAATYLGVSVSLLEKERVAGGGPVYIQARRHGVVRYAMSDLDAWSEGNRRHSTSQPHKERRKPLKYQRLLGRVCKTSANPSP